MTTRNAADGPADGMDDTLSGIEEQRGGQMSKQGR